MSEKQEKGPDSLEQSIGRLEDDIEAVEEKAEEVPQPADQEVLARLESLAADKDDLVERFEKLESGAGGSDAERKELKLLAERLDSEARALLHETEFLSAGARTTLDLILEGTTRLVDAVGGGSSPKED